MSMDALTNAAFESLATNVLPSLLARLRALKQVPAATRESNEELQFLVAEAQELLSLLLAWVGHPPEEHKTPLPASNAALALAPEPKSLKCLLVQIGSQLFAIPLSDVTESVRLAAEALNESTPFETFMHQGQLLPLVRLAQVLRLADEEKSAATHFSVVIVSHDGVPFGLVVDRLLRQQDLTVSPLGKLLQKNRFLSGVSTLPGEGMVLVLGSKSIAQNVQAAAKISMSAAA